MIPVVPGKKATGINTASNTKEVDMVAPVSSSIASKAACRGFIP